MQTGIGRPADARGVPTEAPGSGFEHVMTAAVRARLTREQLIRRIQRGQLEGYRDDAAGWLVSIPSLEAYLAGK